MDFSEKFTAFFFTVGMVGMGFLIYKHTVDQTLCKQSAISQNYAAEQIRMICR